MRWQVSVYRLKNGERVLREAISDDQKENAAHTAARYLVRLQEMGYTYEVVETGHVRLTRGEEILEMILEQKEA